MAALRKGAETNRISGLPSDVQVVHGVTITFVAKTGPRRCGRSERCPRLTESISGLKARRIDAAGAVAVGRLYGDKPRSDGGLEIHRVGAQPETIETVRGVRALAVAMLTATAFRPVYADGWHFRKRNRRHSWPSSRGPTLRLQLELGRFW